jgi:hypothetical protein
MTFRPKLSLRNAVLGALAGLSLIGGPVHAAPSKPAPAKAAPAGQRRHGGPMR